MGMTANQILSKALSTESEDEAISCLKMARKKGLKLEVDINKGYYERKLKDYASVVSALEGDVIDKLRLNTLQRKEIYYLEDKLQHAKDRVYSLEAWLMVTAVAIAVELIVIIIMSN
jgi:cytoplasmic iron level regulating protein YaaA (DUF328/UPF0246 family)